MVEGASVIVVLELLLLPSSFTHLQNKTNSSRTWVQMGPGHVQPFNQFSYFHRDKRTTQAVSRLSSCLWLDREGHVTLWTNHGGAVVIIFVSWFPGFQAAPAESVVTFGTGHAENTAEKSQTSSSSSPPPLPHLCSLTAGSPRSFRSEPGSWGSVWRSAWRDVCFEPPCSSLHKTLRRPSTETCGCS